MVHERTQSLSQRFDGYLRNRLFSGERRRLFKQPIDAVTFDRVDLSGEEPDRVVEYKWLTARVSTMSDDEVARKMKEYRDSFPTIDDALAEKIIMEAV